MSNQNRFRITMHPRAEPAIKAGNDNARANMTTGLPSLASLCGNQRGPAIRPGDKPAPGTAARPRAPRNEVPNSAETSAKRGVLSGGVGRVNSNQIEHERSTVPNCVV